MTQEEIVIPAFLRDKDKPSSIFERGGGEPMKEIQPRYKKHASKIKGAGLKAKPSSLKASSPLSVTVEALSVQTPQKKGVTEIELIRVAIDTLEPAIKADLMQPTTNLYKGLQSAYDFFNERLFKNELPSCLITVQRKSKAFGYFAPVRFQNKDIDTEQHDEIALNPKGFNRSKEEILSTLVHEMVHLWQQHFGKPTKTNPHNREWAEMMKTIGLYPSTTGQPGGKETGAKCSHYITTGGLFEVVVKEYLANNSAILYNDIWEDTVKKKASKASKTKFTCIGCDSNVWGKPETSVICGSCMEPMLPDEPE